MVFCGLLEIFWFFFIFLGLVFFFVVLLWFLSLENLGDGVFWVKVVFVVVFLFMEIIFLVFFVCKELDILVGEGGVIGLSIMVGFVLCCIMLVMGVVSKM